MRAFQWHFRGLFILALVSAPVSAVHAQVGAVADRTPGVALENGDVNGDWERDNTDGVNLLKHLFAGGAPPVPFACGSDVPSRANGDTNGDDATDVSDAIHLFSWLYLGGDEPVAIECEWPGGAARGSGAAATRRSIEEFVAAQGSFCIVPPPMGCESIGATEVDGCCLFVPPIENFFGWTDPASGVFASVDYAGNAEDFIQAASGGALSLGTTTRGSVTERALPDGRAEVHVRLHTRNALAWAFVFDPAIPGNPFANTPLIYGHRAPEVLAGADAALSELLLHTVFINSAPGAPLPDLSQVAEFVTISFYSRGDGPLRELFGVAEGTPGRLQITQTGLIEVSGRVPENAASADAFPAEHIKVRAVGR